MWSSTFVDGSIGEDEDALVVFGLSILKLADVVGAVGVDGSALAVGEALHPVALVVGVPGLDVVVVDAREFVLEFQDGHAIYFTSFLHLLERVSSISWQSLGLSFLIA